MTMPEREPAPAPDWAVLVFTVQAELLAYLRSEPWKRRRRGPSKYRLLRWRKILAVLTADQPMTYKEVAALTGLKPDGQIRADLRELAAQGKVTRVSGVWGYVLSPESSAATGAGDAS